MAATTTYKCRKCGTRLVVTEKMESHLSPVILLRGRSGQDLFCQGENSKTKKENRKEKGCKKEKTRKGKRGEIVKKCAQASALTT